MGGAHAGRLQRLEARVVGDVQGVGFRWFVRRVAVGLGLTGWVANEADGSVAVMAEGPPAALDELQAAIRAGPPGARVDSVSAQRLPPGGGQATFEIRSGHHAGD